MQWLAMFALVLAIAAIYKDRASSIVRRIEDQIGRLKSAKISDLEVTLGDLVGERASELGGIAGKTLHWDEALLMLSVVETGRHRLAPGTQRDLARRLRHLGLVEHDHATMADSEFLAPTPMGLIVGESLQTRLKD